MTTRAAQNIQWIISGKGPAAIVALKAVVSSRRTVLKDRDIRHLAALRDPGAYVMTFLAANALPGGMVAMPEDGLKRIIRLQRPVVRRQSVADGTRTDLALRRVTGVARGVRIDPRLNSLARTRWRMTGRASLCGFALSTLVSGMVKFHVKPLDKLCRKNLHRRLIGIEACVTDRTHRLVFISCLIGYKLIEMTTYARIVAGVFERFVLGLTAVARYAVKLLMLGDLVVKRGEIRRRGLYHRRFGRFRGG